MINEQDLESATGTTITTVFTVKALDLAGNDCGHPILSFLDDARFIDEAAANPSLSVLLVSQELAAATGEAVGDQVSIIVVDDPRWHFYTLHNFLAERNPSETEPTVIAPDARVHPSAHVAPFGVRIGSGATIEANATVLASSRIGDGAVIRAGAVIGTSGFEHKRTSRGVLSVVHDGETRIGPRAEVGSLTVVGRGFQRRHTIVGADSRLDCNVMIAHGSQLGERVFVAAGAVLAGSTEIGDDVWIGPGATLIDRVTVGAGARVGIGSVVFRAVDAGMQVLGNPARATTR
ncbi:DapH/DapD/GlmU-related protein [Agromyces ramosus]|uniref:UDP-3-O-[3-hydroxymyristoyl] glucosamine N-acyltransferase n=1 Tax=Agromyces ramosus TaxID=33879 RepID=A0ABU0RBF6_9MICO|nr:DapH/DapD/GlmU-related protein [Agromyces ramosus]MDQ0895408.1 UDP-3-O-[3-hydroxymyristoyl] glucosamine N-acyltransferase [Agromyces ramosus]